MARGTRRLVFRVVITQAAPGTAVGTVLIELDYGDDEAPRFPSLNSAVSSGLSFVRRYQSAGIDAEAQVYGKVIGADADAPVRALVAGEAAEKLYAHIDTPGKGLLQRIGLANREAAATAELDPDIEPDLAAAV